MLQSWIKYRIHDWIHDWIVHNMTGVVAALPSAWKKKCGFFKIGFCLLALAGHAVVDETRWLEDVLRRAARSTCPKKLKEYVCQACLLLCMGRSGCWDDGANDRRCFFFLRRWWLAFASEVLWAAP